MENPIIIQSRSVYGNELWYVVSEHAQDIKTLTHKETVNMEDVQALEGLGFEVKASIHGVLVPVEEVEVTKVQSAWFGPNFAKR